MAADGGGDDNSHSFQFSGGGEECIVVGLDFLLEVERKVDCYVQLLVDFRSCGTVVSLADDLEELFDGPIVDGLEIGAASGAEDRFGDVGAECVGGGVSDGLFDPDDRLVASDEALHFFVGIGARGDFGLDGCALAFGSSSAFFL